MGSKKISLLVKRGFGRFVFVVFFVLFVYIFIIFCFIFLFF
jgi:hypothetical protein